MFKKNKEFRYMVWVSLVLAVVGVLFSCIAMNEVLKVKRIKLVDVWKVDFVDLMEEKIGTASSFRPTLNSTSISDFKVGLMRKGDKVIYKFKVRNSGTVDARIKVLSDIAPTCTVNDINSSTDVCSKVNYLLTYNNGELVKIGDVVSAGTSKEILLSVEYFGDNVTAIEINNLDFMLLFEQV